MTCVARSIAGVTDDEGVRAMHWRSVCSCQTTSAGTRKVSDQEKKICLAHSFCYFFSHQKSFFIPKTSGGDTPD